MFVFFIFSFMLFLLCLYSFIIIFFFCVCVFCFSLLFFLGGSLFCCVWWVGSFFLRWGEKVQGVNSTLSLGSLL